MDYFAFEEQFYGGEKVVQDDALGEAAAKIAREGTPPAPHGMESSAKVIAEFSNKDRILSAEEIIEHRKHCRAKPGNCPFEKARDEVDDISPADIRISKQTVFNRLAALLTQMFNMSKNLAKPAIVEPEHMEEKVNPTISAPAASSSNSFIPPAAGVAQDEAPAEAPDADAKLVAEIIESGIEKMVELAKSNGCTVNMDEKKTKYIVEGPKDTPEK